VIRFADKPSISSSLSPSSARTLRECAASAGGARWVIRSSSVVALVPGLDVCVVDHSAIVAGVPDAFERIRADSPATFVSGPSSTSDIELSRVRGVHGLRRLEVVIAQR
jgi:hypothetical protein